MKQLLSGILIGILSVFTAKADSLDVQLGQMIMVGMQGHTYAEKLPILTALDKGIVGGIIFFEYNIAPTQSRERLNELTAKLQTRALLGQAHLPLFIAIDQEGGQVNRLKPKYGFPPMLSAKVIGDTSDGAVLYQAADTLVRTLNSVGINMNFAPVADLHNPLCPVLGNRNRCFSANPERVTYCDSVILVKHQQAGLIAAMKHFPGHGNSRTDSHLGLTDITPYWVREELIPYRRMIKAKKVPMIMMGHVVHKKLDSLSLPASLSKKMISDLLRKELGFDGVVVSDDMQMHAIASRYSLRESVYLGLEAGIDLFIFSNNIVGASTYSPENIHATMRQLVEEGKVSRERIRKSYERILKLKQGMQVSTSYPED